MDRERLLLAATLAADAVIVALALATTTRNDHVDSSASSREQSGGMKRKQRRSQHLVDAACQLYDVAALTALRAALVVFVARACGVILQTTARRHRRRGGERGWGWGIARQNGAGGAMARTVLSAFHALCSVGFLAKAIARAVLVGAGACGRSTWGAQAIITCSVFVGWVQVELVRAVAETRERVGATGVPGERRGDRFTQLLEGGERDGEGGDGGGWRGGGGLRSRSEGSSSDSTRRGSELDSQLAADDRADADADADADDAKAKASDAAAAEAEMEEDRDWPCGPETCPEPWRENVPQELQRVVEDAFAAYASRVRALLNDVHYHAVDEAVRGRPFVPAGEVSRSPCNPNRIRAWHQLSQSDRPETCPRLFISLMDVPLSVTQLERTVSDPSVRPEWDVFCQLGRGVHRYNPCCERVEYVMKGMWPIKPRDQQLITAKRTLPNGGRMYVATSLPPEFAPPPKRGVTRARLRLGGYYVSPKPGGACDGGTPAPWDGEDGRRRPGGGGGEGEGGATGTAAVPASASDHERASSATPSGGRDPGAGAGAASPAAVMVVSLLHLDLANGVPRSVYWFVARRFAGVMENFRKFAVKRGKE